MKIQSERSITRSTDSNSYSSRGRKPTPDKLALSKFVLLDRPKAPKKEYIRAELIRLVKKAVRKVLAGKECPLYELSNHFVQLVTANREIIERSGLAATATDPSKKSKAKSFNKVYCQWFFLSEGCIMSYLYDEFMRPLYQGERLLDELEISKVNQTDSRCVEALKLFLQSTYFKLDEWGNELRAQLSILEGSPEEVADGFIASY
mmetsp:Transcript_11019/g.21600  ORF Transcript_11019/g.21600 Transcript_11019/m.21600 type:complete len:205 (+) Transcript_11019:686-1300(+)